MPATLAVAPVRRSVRVAAPPARAFELFTTHIARWWPRSHSVSSVPMQAAIIEPRAGGRWYERGEDGSECDWGKVLAWEPPARLLLAWHLNARFKYDPDVFSEVEVRFLAEGSSATRVELEHRALERLGPDAALLREKVGSPNGWHAILERYVTTASETP